MSVSRTRKRSTERPSDSDESLHQAQQVLVVDDDFEIAQTFRHALMSVGYRTMVAHNGDEAIAYIETKKPDLVILDIMMPKRSGLLVLESLRQNVETPVPVIVITGNQGSRHREYAEMLGVTHYLHKPVTMERLQEVVKQELEV